MGIALLIAFLIIYNWLSGFNLFFFLILVFLGIVFIFRATFEITKVTIDRLKEFIKDII
jgi:hypothetical protein